MNQEKLTALIDIREDYLSKKDHLLEILLQDKTTSKSVLMCSCVPFSLASALRYEIPRPSIGLSPLTLKNRVSGFAR